MGGGGHMSRLKRRFVKYLVAGLFTGLDPHVVRQPATVERRSCKQGNITAKSKLDLTSLVHNCEQTIHFPFILTLCRAISCTSFVGISLDYEIGSLSVPYTKDSARVRASPTQGPSLQYRIQVPRNTPGRTISGLRRAYRPPN